MTNKKKITEFDLPENHQIIKTDYWLLGNIEGEGSFCLAKQVLLA
jgi:hypothetical protein